MLRLITVSKTKFKKKEHEELISVTRKFIFGKQAKGPNNSDIEPHNINITNDYDSRNNVPLINM